MSQQLALRYVNSDAKAELTICFKIEILKTRYFWWIMTEKRGRFTDTGIIYEFCTYSMLMLLNIRKSRRDAFYLYEMH